MRLVLAIATVSLLTMPAHAADPCKDAKGKGGGHGPAHHAVTPHKFGHGHPGIHKLPDPGCPTQPPLRMAHPFGGAKGAMHHAHARR